MPGIHGKMPVDLSAENWLCLQRLPVVLYSDAKRYQSCPPFLDLGVTDAVFRPTFQQSEKDRPVQNSLKLLSAYFLSRDTDLPVLSVCPMLMLCLNDCSLYIVKLFPPSGRAIYLVLPNHIRYLHYEILMRIGL